MQIKIKQPAALYEAGGASINEDFIFPIHNQANPEEKLFVVCDGDGGPNRGEIASKLVALSLAKFFASSPPKGALNQAYLDEALQAAEDALTAYQESHQDTQGMKTTLALVHLGTDQVTLAWVGDTQIYHYKHREAAVEVITTGRGNPDARISGNTDPQSLLVTTIPSKEVRVGDAFLLASGGIAKQLEINTLTSILQAGADHSPQHVVEQIDKLATTDKSGNYSCYLIQVERLETGAAAAAATPEKESAGAAGTAHKDSADEPAKGSRFTLTQILVGAVIIILLAFGSVAIYSAFNNPFKKEMKEGKRLLAEGKYEDAKAQFERAEYIADSLENLDDFREAKVWQDSVNNLLLAQDRSVAAQMSIEQLIEAGREFYNNSNYLRAIEDWQQAKNLIAQSEAADDTLLPRLDMLNAYRQLADEAYENENLEDARAYYRAAQDMISGFEQEGQPVEDNLETQIAQRLENIDLKLGIDPDKQVASSEAGTRSTSRSISPAEETAPSPSAARRVGGASDNQASRTNEPTTSSFDKSSLTPEQEAELKKALSTGKRFYSEAKQQESSYLYRSSIDKLEAAGPMLDGSGAYLLAYMYHSGLGVEANEAKALQYAQLSARKNWPAGQYYYGYLLLQREYPRDTVTALQSLQLAANQNYLDAIDLLKKLR